MLAAMLLGSVVIFGFGLAGCRASAETDCLARPPALPGDRQSHAGAIVVPGVWRWLGREGGIGR